MNREDIKNYLSNPASLDKKSGLALKEIIGTFPYYSLLYLLLARAYKNEKDPALQDVIGKAAAYSPDREGLYRFLHAQGETNRAAVAPGIQTAQADDAEPVEVPEPNPAATGPVATPESPADDAPAATVPPAAAAAGTSLEKRAADPGAIALNIDDQVPRTFTVWLRRVRQVTSKDADTRLDMSDALEKNYYQELITKNTEKEYLSHTGVEFDPEKKEDRIIAKFIKEDPQVIKSALTIQAKEPLAGAGAAPDGDDEVISETLAKIYIDQNLTEKAVLVYRKLSLKFPEKSAYFAGLIEKLKK